MLMDTTVMIIFRLITGEMLSFLSIDISTSIASLFPKHQYCSIYQLRERARINRACSYQHSVLVSTERARINRACSYQQSVLVSTERARINRACSYQQSVLVSTERARINRACSYKEYFLYACYR